MATLAIKDRRIPWDAYLEEELDRIRAKTPDQRKHYLTMLRQHIDGFRGQEWPGIRRDLERDYDFSIPDDIEPHWAAPGKAHYWMEQSVVERVVQENGVTVLQPRNYGWQRTLPLPAGNANIIHGYLRKGFRLRPPEEGAKVSESDDPPEGEGVPQPMPFVCKRHAEGSKSFISWKAYIQHCMVYGEPPIEEPPQEVLLRGKQFLYYCAAHDKGFNHKRHAAAHLKAELRRPRRGKHLSLEQMLVIKENN